MGFGAVKRRIRYALKGVDALPGMQMDGVRVTDKNTSFLDDPKFQAAWEFARKGNEEAWYKLGYVPDIRWRAHVCCWAAHNVANLEGDFVEFGVHGGILSMAVCHYLDFAKADKKFYLFDTYEGIPTDGLSGVDLTEADKRNSSLYFDVFKIATRNFSPFPNAVLVKGTLPTTLDATPISKIAYLSVDLNSTRYEKECIERTWDRIVPGGHIVLDDYAHKRHEDQYDMWNQFTAERGHMVLTLPTGQGLIVKH
ncbi:methyltransferase [Sinorhizobium sp. A49]|uniref:TylF/MycF/NovP-related O-methyltransferase n=1 Tax=Sinorhizobium sp. A49 TaxID=1945861 RepID=UPI000985B19F|nr:TylF/MycF/NovP-related O-methyltransferase [Sinorhizobium sp. A49]OOG65845.1 methyltransferase [Sinorhizobium sp. A49]